MLEHECDSILCGPVISDTMRTQDLLPAFVDTARALPLSQDEEDLLAGIEFAFNAPDYWNSESAQMDLDILFDLLNGHAPEGHYFGAHPGDGACFGFWYVE